MPGALQAHAYQEYYQIRSELRSILQHLINLWLGAAQAFQFTVSIKLDKYDIQH